MVRLDPMTDAEFEEYLARAVPRRAERYVQRGVWKGEQSNTASRALYARLLPEGNRTPGHHFRHIVDESSEARVGEVWYTARPEGGLVQFWIEWIWIDPAYRRRGFAKAAIVLLESEAKRLGATRVGLDVWVDNPGALALYEALGYRPARTSMIKSLVASPGR